MIAPSEYFSIDDGYGIIGQGYVCGHCGKENNFVDVVKGQSEDCSSCGMVNTFNVDRDY